VQPCPLCFHLPYALLKLHDFTMRLFNLGVQPDWVLVGHTQREYQGNPQNASHHAPDYFIRVAISRNTELSVLWLVCLVAKVIKMPNDKLPLGAIPSDAGFVLFSEKEGLISEHIELADAMQYLAFQLQADWQSKAVVYERAKEWTKVM
jgi:hypothetical protein